MSNNNIESNAEDNRKLLALVDYLLKYTPRDSCELNFEVALRKSGMVPVEISFGDFEKLVKGIKTEALKSSDKRFKQLVSKYSLL